MSSSITLLTSAGAVRVAGEGLVIDLRQFANAPEGPQLNDEPSPEVGPQAEASHVGTDTGMPADREGRRDGEAASVDLPTNPETPADTAPRRQADRAGEATPPASPATILHRHLNINSQPDTAKTGAHAADEESMPRGPVTNSSNDAIGEVKGSARLPNATGVEPSLPEADAGGPVSASAPHSNPAERHPARSVSSAFVSSQPAGSVGVPHSKPHKSGKLEVQPANLSDPSDPGPIPSWMDRRAKKDVAA